MMVPRIYVIGRNRRPGI